jgi:hypothetical protein
MSEQQGYGWIQTLSTTIFSGSTTGITSSIAGIYDYNSHTFQYVAAISASANATSSVTIRSSLDNVNFISPFVLGPLMSNTSSLITTITGRRNSFQYVLATVGNISSSLYLISGQ